MAIESTPPYVELRARSAFSWMDGTATPEALAHAAADLGHSSLALVDGADFGGAVRFHRAASDAGIRPLLGQVLHIQEWDASLALLVRSRSGMSHLAHLVTKARTDAPRGRPSIRLDDLESHSEGLHVLTGHTSGPIGRPLLKGSANRAHAHATWLHERFPGRLAIEVQQHYVSAAEQSVIARSIELAKTMDVPWVATGEPRYLSPEGRLVHDLLTAQRSERTVQEAAGEGRLLPNGTWQVLSPEAMARRWAGREEGLVESRRIADACAFEIEWLRPPMPDFRTPESTDDDAYLRTVAFDGARERWGETLTEAQRRQLEHELDVIARLGFSGYFLVMWEAVQYAKRNNILCQGRGSAANSAVAYVLGISAVDPVRHGLLFERFLSAGRTEGRAEAPDIDVDFEMHRREEVLQHVYKRYGRRHAAITAMTQTYHAPSALKDVMRSLGYPADASSGLSKRLRNLSPSDGAAALRSGLAGRHGLELDTPSGRAILTALSAMDDLPRLRSTHPGGFVISRAPLGDFIPIEPTSQGRTILQFDKDDLDEAGVPKYDFLGLGGLTAVRLAFDAVRETTGEQLQMYSIPEDDEKTFELIRAADTVGLFQIESRAQIASLVKTQPEALYDLVVQVALIRPGPIQAQFVHPYIRRRRGLEEPDYRDERLRPVLERTLGIPIFQEQAMAIAMKVAGYTGAEADEFRRSMGHQRKLERLRRALDELRRRLVENDMDEEVAADLTKDLEAFANYGFPESHAWSFAMIAYTHAWLKANYPAPFYLGLLNAMPMGFYPASVVVNDAIRRGLDVHPPCVLDGWDDTVLEMHEGEGANRPLRLGWRTIRGLSSSARSALTEAKAAGSFRSVDDVVRRAEIGKQDALLLARAGAFDGLVDGRRQAAWKALGSSGDRLPLAPGRRLPFRPQEMDETELIFLDYLATGISTRGHPMEHLRPRLDSAGVLNAKTVREVKAGSREAVAGLVVTRQRPVTAKGTVFLLLEDEHGFINVIVPPDIYRANKETVDYASFMAVRGRVEREGPLANVVAERFAQAGSDLSGFASKDFR